MRGKLTQKFFDNAWRGLGAPVGKSVAKRDLYYSANFEFVEKAKEENFDLHQVLEIVTPKRGAGGHNWHYNAIVPFDTMQGNVVGATMWHGFIPIAEDEIELFASCDDIDANG